MAYGKLRSFISMASGLGLGILGCSSAPDESMGAEEETAEMQQALCASNDLAVSASSASSGTSAPAFDNNVGSRWESTHGVDPQWIQIDLGASKLVNRVRIDWETANAKDYSVRISNDAAFGTYTTLVTKTNMATANHRIDDLTGLSGKGRYVRMNGTARTTGYGYSIWEMDVYGDANTSCNSCTPTTSCSEQGKTCGTIYDGCATVSCGSCGSGQTCSASNVCVATNQPCAGACTAGQTCNISNQCVTESCGGTCAMGQKCVNSTCVANTSADVSYYNSGKTLESVPSGFFGSNVKLYKHDSNPTTIASDIQAAYSVQRDAQFGTRRDGFLFAPGTYAAELDIGFNTQISGLGDHPDTVTMTGWLLALPPTDMGNNGMQTVWRSIENFKHGNANTLWAVSQAAPMRRVHAIGVVALHQSWGWQSGGFIADSAVDGNLHFGSQQQFYTRNSQLAKGEDGAWNIVYQGVTGTKLQVAFPAGSMTDIASTPVIREKPFLYVNRDGLFKVFVPALRTNAVGTTWSGGTTAGTSIPLSGFHVAKEGVDTATSMNNALNAGKHLLITPGVYNLDAPLVVNNPNTIVLGMGLATLVAQNGVNAINVADVDGVILAGLLIDAGTGDSPALIQVGPATSATRHNANPTSLHDIFTRIGGRGWIAKAKKSMVVNSNDVIIDHTWLWRADHGAGVGWTLNTAQNGLLVNGGWVTAYGTHVEHFQEYQVKWNGNNGKNYFFQNELPYEAPSQAAYDDPPNPTDQNTGNGYASYKVADSVTSHEFYGGGCYAVFTMNDCTTGSQCASGVCEADGKCAAPAGGMNATRCIEAPEAQVGVKFRNILALSLTDKGKINNLINNDGRTANAADISTYPKVAAWH